MDKQAAMRWYAASYLFRMLPFAGLAWVSFYPETVIDLVLEIAHWFGPATKARMAAVVGFFVLTGITVILASVATNQEIGRRSGLRLPGNRMLYLSAAAFATMVVLWEPLLAWMAGGLFVMDAVVKLYELDALSYAKPVKTIDK